MTVRRSNARDSGLILLLCIASGCSFVHNNGHGHYGLALQLTAADFIDQVVSASAPALATATDFFSTPLAASLFGVAGVYAVINSRPRSRLVNDALLKQITQGTFLQNSVDQLQCVYKASRDNWSAQDFHDKVDNLGSAVVIAQVSRGIGSSIIGGYNPNGWRSTDDYYLSNQAFLFTATNSNRNIVKLPIIPGSNAPALFDYATAGPCFGTTDLQIGPLQAAFMGGFAGPDMEDTRTNAGDLRQGKSSVVNFEWTDQWPVRGSFRVVEVEVYCKM
ncbi:hypothetical protein MPSEU_000804000 [Mayamaea pseudoterrestris]|nr:hypothetical protein MPSEU_000804000 [Mayamaea pseudoterrestris]